MGLLVAPLTAMETYQIKSMGDGNNTIPAKMANLAALETSGIATTSTPARTQVRPTALPASTATLMVPSPQIRPLGPLTRTCGYLSLIRFPLPFRLSSRLSLMRYLVDPIHRLNISCLILELRNQPISDPHDHVGQILANCSRSLLNYPIM